MPPTDTGVVVPDLLTEDARLLVARLARQLAADDEVEGRRVSDREWALLLLAMIAAVREETA